MAIYWIVFLIPSLFALVEKPYQKGKTYYLFISCFLFTIFLFVAFRKTGGDYENYLHIYDFLAGADLHEALTYTEPLYGLLNWLSAEIGWGLHGVNAICALILLYGLYRFSEGEPLPILLMAISIPYVVIVLGMGYTRQGVALALIMIGLKRLSQGYLYWFIIHICLATGFHYSALITLGLPAISGVSVLGKSFVIFKRVLLVVLAIYAAQFLFPERIESYKISYIESDIESHGATLRSLVHAMAAAGFYVSMNSWKRHFQDFSLWLPFSFLAILSLPLSFYSSTAVDRIGLYLLPFQLITLARLPYLHSQQFAFVKSGILFGYAAYFFVWLHLGIHSSMLWIPYQSLLW